MVNVGPTTPEEAERLGLRKPTPIYPMVPIDPDPNLSAKKKEKVPATLAMKIVAFMILFPILALTVGASWAVCYRAGEWLFDWAVR